MAAQQKKSTKKTAEQQPSRAKSAGKSKGTLQSLVSAFTGDEEDAGNILKADHRHVEDLFQEYEDATSPSQKARIAETVCRELIVHSTLEEQLFYPACREAGVDDDLLDEAQVEHDGAKVLISELLSESPNSEFYDAKVKVLSEYVKHHVREEEKFNGIIAKARLSDIDMEELGRRMLDRKEELMQRMEGHLRPPKPRALHAVQIPGARDLGVGRGGRMMREHHESGRMREFSRRPFDEREGWRMSEGGNGGRRSSRYRNEEESERFARDYGQQGEW